MILKSFELSKIDSSKNSIFLIYGQNEGLKNDITKKLSYEMNFSRLTPYY